MQILKEPGQIPEFQGWIDGVHNRLLFLTKTCQGWTG